MPPSSVGADKGTIKLNIYERKTLKKLERTAVNTPYYELLEYGGIEMEEAEINAEIDEKVAKITAKIFDEIPDECKLPYRVDFELQHRARPPPLLGRIKYVRWIVDVLGMATVHTSYWVRK